ncbi:MAG: MFS transporter [Chitinispirillales bacterium]|jgi:UMF1 family MFS transporter|nr:MFS transporter [Chitinispirillales bacterium]
MSGNNLNKKVLSWCLYDWANSAFALTVLAGFFPMFFKSYYNGGQDAIRSTMWLGAGHTAAGFIIAVLSLILGALADSGMGKKRFLGVFLVLGAFSTAALFLVSQGAWVTALILFILGNIGFSCSGLFYDSLLVDVADNKSMDFVSSLGFALGYIGSVFLFIVNVLMTIKPALFGLTDISQAVKVSFLSVSLWWLVFSVPLFLFVTEKKRAGGTAASAVKSIANTFGTIKKTFFAIVKKRALLLFLCAWWLYFDGVNTFIRMAVDFGLSIGFGSNALMAALILVQIVAFPSSLLFGYLSQRVGTGRMIAAGIIVYIFVTGFGSFLMITETHFIILACFTGFAQGGIQALSRSYFGKLIPAEKSTEYFSFYNVVARFAVIGPAIVGIAAMTARQAGARDLLASRIGMSSVNIFFILGLFFLFWAEKARAAAFNSEEMPPVEPLTACVQEQI